MKTKILNIVPISISCEGEVSLGPLYVSAALKNAGFISRIYFPDLSLILPFNYSKYELIMYQLNNIMAAYKPEIVTFSTLTTNYKIAAVMAKQIKKRYGSHVIFGGIHSIVDGKNVINNDYIDAVCEGEGEFSLPEYINKLLNNQLTEHNRSNLSYKISNKIIVADKTMSFPALDEYPLPDRESLRPYYERGRLSVANFITSRGCPFNCFYCTAELLNQNKGYLRLRSPDNVINEILETKQKYRIKKAVFSDESFTAYKDNLFNILKLYRQKIGLPFDCQTRVETITDEVACELKGSGCEFISLGIESGNPAIRKKYLNRKMSDEQIIKAFHILKKHDIKTNSFNMLGLPEETEKSIWQGIALNKLAGVDNVAISVFMPLKGTKLYEWYQSRKLIVSDPETNYHEKIIIKHPNIARRALLFYLYYYQYLIASKKPVLGIKEKIILFGKMYMNIAKQYLINVIKQPLMLLTLGIIKRSGRARLFLERITENDIAGLADE